MCWRMRGDKPQFLLVTSRQRKRWIIPKGWPVDRATPSETAHTEAWEEAGVKGKVFERCLGIYSYNKYLEGGTHLPCVVAVFPVKVKNLAVKYP
ncbi:MAG: NUDIX hydrolase [Pseudomonadota bacterium]